MEEKPDIPLLRLDPSGVLSGEEYHDDESYNEKLQDVELREQPRRRRRLVNCNFCLFLLFFILLVIVFFEVTFWHFIFGPKAMYSVDREGPSTTITYPQDRLPEHWSTNGTHDFGPTTIFVVLAGLGSSMLHSNTTPNLVSIAQEGIAPPHLIPPFPALDGPTVWTLATGLYPVTHGIVSDNFFDSNTNTTFNYTDPKSESEPRWYPYNQTIWQTTANENLSTVLIDWPNIIGMSNVSDYLFIDDNRKRSPRESLSQLIQYIDLDDDQRPQFIAVFIDELAQQMRSPNVTKSAIRTTLTRLDRDISSLYQALQLRNLSSIANLVIASDHGSSSSTDKKTLYLEDYIDLERIASVEGLPLAGLRPLNSDSLNTMYWDLWIRSMVMGSHFNVFTGEKLPKTWNYWPSSRVAPLWLVPDAGYSFKISKNETSRFGQPPSGSNIAYDPEQGDMAAIFLATGPAFRPVRDGKRGIGNVESFASTAVKRLLCDSLSLSEHRCSSGDVPANWTLEFII